MKQAIICFTRVPKPGQTKTRLLPILSPEQCAQLHTSFLQDLAACYEKVSADLFVAYTEDPEWQKLKDIFPTAIDFFPQMGKNLGEKMLNAITLVLDRGYDFVVLTGSDLPLLTAEHLESGFIALGHGEVCLGPTGDGGYYLVGMKKPQPAIFEKQQYGGSTVWENTVFAAKQAGLNLTAALPCDDIDTPEDLKKLWLLIRYKNSYTATCLKKFRKEGVDLDL